MKKIKILHIIHWPKSGISNLVYNQIISSKSGAVSYRVGFFILDNETRHKFEKAGIDVVDYGYSVAGFFNTLIKIFLDLKKTEPQIVHTHSFLPGIFVRLIHVFRGRFKLISTIHNSYPYFTGKTLKDRVKTFFEINSINIANSRIITVSKFVKEFLRENTNINTSLIDVIYPGIIIDDKDSPPCGKALAENRVITVGRLDEQKRHDRLLLIWKKVSEKKPAAMLDIAGDGSEKNNLLRMASELKITDSVNFLGFREDISELLKRSSFSVLTSSHEGLGLVILESFLCRKPVIAFDIGPLKEVIDNGCGILVRPFDLDEFADKIIFLLNNPEIVEAMGRNGHEKVKRLFDIDNMVKQIEDGYRGMLCHQLITPMNP